MPNDVKEPNKLKIARTTLAIGFLLLGQAEMHARPILLPPIIAQPTNAVPSCVTPSRLMEFVDTRNRRLSPPREFDRRFSDVASAYKSFGECVQRKPDGQCLGIRWDYAFFQMLLETNYLLFTGGVRPGDNNFAGIGATVAGKPGEQFSSIDKGVHAHLQHLLMYAGVTIRDPVAKRTRIVSEYVQKKLNYARPVTFSDMAKLWAASGGNPYAGAVEKIARSFRAQFCR